MEFEKYRLSQLLTIKNGRDYKSLGQGSVPVFGSGGYMCSVDSYLYDRPSVLLPRKGTLSNIQYYNKGPFWTVDTCYYTIVNENLVDSYYVYRYLRNLNLSGLDTGASIPSMTQKTYNGIKILLPNLSIQHRIASILSTYDSLIENNTKRIRLLEKMAENLYKEWFVRFRFPGHENVEMENSKYGKLPKTFEIVKMNEVFDYYIGGGWGEEERSEGFPEEARVIRGADFPNIWHYDVSSCPKRYHKAKNYKARQLEDGDIIMEISGGTSEQPVGRTVLVTEDLLERFPNKRLICASFCKLIRLKKDVVSPYYFYYWMKFLYNTRIIDRFQLQSTGIINFKFEPFLRRGDVVLPPKEVMLAFEKQVSLCHKEMNQLAKQNSLLARQRDLLLPRLMSGKLEVKEELLE